MQTIGDRLEEARKHKGVSLREAAEATKIRGEYISAFESNSFDINLPEIYIRGFLRNYANFLKLNGTQILTDYDALASGEPVFSSGPKREGQTESYGRMDLGENRGAGAAESPKSAPLESEEPQERRRESTFGAYEALDKGVYLKVGAIVAGGLVAVFLLVSAVLWVIRSDPEETAGAGANAEQPGGQEFFLIARDTISEVRVTEVDTGLELYEGSLEAGDRQRLIRNGPVDIYFSNGEHLRIEHEGSRFRVGGSGEGRARFDL